MDLYLLKDNVFEIMFGWRSPDKVFAVAANLFLRDKKLSPTGQGVVSNKIFPWAVDLLNGPEPEPETETFGFHLKVSFEVTPYGTPPMLTTIVTGDFADLLKYVYGIAGVPECLKLKFSAALAILGGKYGLTIVHDMEAVTTNGAVEFKSESVVDPTISRAIWDSANECKTSAKITIELSAQNDAVSGPVDALNLNNKIFQEKRNPDFVLISENGVEFPCHKGFLNAHSSFFELMFETDCKEMQSGKAKLNLSEEGLKAFLDFVYCFKLDFLKEHPSIAVELLGFAHEKQITRLEEAMKKLILGKPNDWMDLNDGVQLFLLSVKLDSQEGYADVKKKAVKAIKAKRDELKESALCKELLMTNSEATMELLHSCLE